MKGQLLLASVLLTLSMSAVAQIKTQAIGSWTIQGTAPNTFCRAGTFDITPNANNPNNSVALGMQICRAMGNFTTAGMARISGGNGGPWRDTTNDLDIVGSCSVKTTGQAKGLLACGSSN